MAPTLHPDEIHVDVPLVRALVAREVPDWSALPVRRATVSGSSASLFHLGDDLLVRLPRQPGGSATVLKEARWIAELAPWLDVATPRVVHVGAPAEGYPEHWSITRWLPGEVPHASAPARSAQALATDLAGVVTSLARIPMPDEALRDPNLQWYRGGPLQRLDDDTRANIAACRRLPGLDLDLDLAERVWADAMTLPDYVGPPRWCHGDVLSENLLVREGRLTAVLDFGALAIGDPTVDLMGAWEVLDDEPRRVFRDAVGVDESTWLRGRAWALCIALMTFPYYWHTMPIRCADRLLMARAVLRDAA